MAKSDKLVVADSLAVKYRPRKFDDLVGNQSTLKVIKGLFQNRKLPKTWLLSGVSGSGKTSSARIIAMTVNCQDLQGINPCLKCDSCLSALKDGNPDIIELNAAGEEGGVGEFRRVLEISKYRPKFNYRCLVLDEIHGLSAKAKQEVLKPLEEPSPHAVWLLCTTAPEKMPKALYGRCLKLFFNYPEPRDLAKRLLKIVKIEWPSLVDTLKPHLVSIALGVGCQPRDAISTLELIAAGASSKQDMSEEEVKELIADNLAQSGELDSRITKFLSHLFLGKKFEPLKILSNLEDTRCEEFLQTSYRYSLYACMYILHIKKKEKFDKKGFYGVNFSRWDMTLDKLKDSVGESLPLHMCTAITSATEKLRLGLVSPQQALLFAVSNYFAKG